jgi:low temperature requirement protein LtrA
MGDCIMQKKNSKAQQKNKIKHREIFFDLIGRAKTKKQINKILDYFDKKKIDVGDDYTSMAAAKYMDVP